MMIYIMSLCIILLLTTYTQTEGIEQQLLLLLTPDRMTELEWLVTDFKICV